MARNYAATRLPASSDLHQCIWGIATRQHRATRRRSNTAKTVQSTSRRWDGKMPSSARYLAAVRRILYCRRRGDESQTFAFEIQSETPHVVSYILARHGLFQPAWLFYRLIKVAEEIRVEPCRH